MKKTLLISIFLICSLILSKSSFCQLTVDTTATAQQLVNTILGPAHTASNIKLTCSARAIAAFSGTSNIGFERGIILTTGMASLAKGPNNKKNAGYDNGAAGDKDLAAIIGKVSTYDGCALEFDFTPSGDSLKMKYVFGSEEYPEYVNNQFTDGLAFFISGPGITGSKNIAVIPTTTKPVSVNTLNDKAYSEYYIDNTNGTTIQYDGFTIPITAFQPVIPFSTYHLKIVVADVTDGIFDSGVFIEAGSVTFTGIKSPQLQDASIRIYPNPATDMIYIQTPFNGNKNMSATIYSVIGKSVYQENYVNNGQPHAINTETIPANGIYFIKLQCGNETVTRKIKINH